MKKHDKEGEQADESEEEGCRDQDKESRHAGASSRIFGATGRLASRRRKASGKRSALAVTRIDDVDMAIAAINGVAWPVIAIGTAKAL